MNTLQKLLKMRDEVAAVSSDTVSANVLFAAYVQEVNMNESVKRELKATCRAYLLLMDEIKALSRRMDALAEVIKK